MVWTIDGTVKLKPELEAELQEKLEAAKASAATLDGEGLQGPDIAALEARLRAEMKRHPAYGYPDDTVVIPNSLGAGYTWNPETGKWDAPPREALKAEALRQVDAEHAHVLNQLTGGASIEERDTWKTKEDAARALIDEKASKGQTAMLTLEAEAKDMTAADLAQTIIAKATGYQMLIGKASALKAAAKTAIAAATADTVPDDKVETILAAAMAKMAEQAKQEVQKFLKGGQNG
ncbi:MAG: hypothetical protein ACWA40_08260 [Planktomarina sp.]